MGSHYTQVARGIRKVSEIVAPVGAGWANALLIYQVTTAPPAGVARTVIIRKIWVYSGVGAAIVDLGIGAPPAFAGIIPTLNVVNLQDTQWTEDEIPEVEVGQDLYVACTPLGVNIQIEVEVIGP